MPASARPTSVFQDTEFRPGRRSIGGGKHAHAKWCRVHEFDSVPVSPKLFDIIEADAIKQGELGDCWLLAAFACVSDFPGHIKDLFTPREYAQNGRYEVRLFDISQGWTTVVIDDMIPCHPLGRVPCFCQVQSGGGIWPLLLEKAFAKFCGSYQHLEGGGSIWAWQVLTGVRSALAYSLTPSGSYEEWRLDVQDQMKDPANWRVKGMKGLSLTATNPVPSFTADQFFGRLAYLDQADCLISASILGDEMEKRRADGLIELHAYSVLEVQKAHGQCLVKLRNPWGQDEWNGAYSDKSPEWARHPELAADLQLEQENDGEFWMPWHAFAQIFNDVKVSPGRLLVPKQSRTGGRKTTGPKCAHCKAVMVRVWCLTNGAACAHGEWTRLQDGDLCFMCRRSLVGLKGVRRELQRVPGIDVFYRYPRLEQPDPPQRHEICPYGPLCYRHNPDHFVEFAHPWLGLNFSGKAWREHHEKREPSKVPNKEDVKEGMGPEAESSFTDADVHEMLNLSKQGQWSACLDMCRQRPGLANRRPSERNWAVIHRAAASGDLDVVRELIEALGADPELATGDGMSAAQVAERGTAEGCAAVVAYLRGAAATASRPAPSATPGAGSVPYDPSATTAICRRMLAFCKKARGAAWRKAFEVADTCPGCVNCRPSGENFGAIHYAARQGNLAALQRLVERYDADTSLLNWKGRTAYDSAVHHGHRNCAMYLQSLSRSRRRRESSQVGSEFAMLLEEDDVWIGPAASQCHADVELQQKAMEAHAEAFAAASAGKWEWAFAALQRSAGLVDLTASGRDWALLHLASYAGAADAVKRLLGEFAADPLILTEDGKTPAQLAEERGHTAVVSLLQDAEVCLRKSARRALVSEALAGRGSADQSKLQLFQAAFAKWDTDGSGTIERGELVALFQQLSRITPVSAIDEIFDACDRNKDGRVEVEEFVAWWEEQVL